MFDYFYITANHVERVTADENYNWINISPPFELESLEQFATEHGLDYSHLTDCLDLYERSRFEMDTQYKLIVLNTPVENNNIDIEDEAAYLTIPIGIIYFNNIIYSISAAKNPLIEWAIKHFEIVNESYSIFDNFSLNIFKKNVYYFLYYLRKINNRISHIEKDLKFSSSNTELNNLLKIQKSLIYFVNDLRSDELLLLKIKRNHFFDTDNEVLKNEIQDIIVEYSQAIEMSNVYSTILGNMMSAFGSIISNNLAHVVNRLTSVTIILMVPTLIAGFYGMNINLPFQHHQFAVVIVSIIAIVITIGLIYYLRFKKWI